MVPALPAWAQDAATGDLNADGLLDVFILPKGGGGIVLHGIGGGRFVRADEDAVEQLGFSPVLALGDVDGDGDLDAVAPPYVLEQQAGTFAASQEIPWTGSAAGVALGDVDGDGDLDLLAGGTSSILHLNDGTGLFTPAPGALPPGSYAGALALADLDGDGDLDALAGGYPDLCLLNAGGTFVPGPAMPTSGSGEFALNDVDGDGDVDGVALVANGAVLLTNDGAAGFAGTALSVGIQFADAVLDDFDGSGVSDLVAFTTSGALAWTSAGGTLVPGGLDFPSHVSALAAVAGDLDQDGDSDLMAFPHGSFDTARLWLSDGHGRFGEFQERVGRPRFPQGVASIATGDVDGDGHVDVLAGDLDFERDALYLGNGAGDLVEASGKLPNVDEITMSVLLHDLDGDGALDAALGGYANDIHILRNDGTGTFASAGAPAGSDHAYTLTVGDVDADGDADLFATHPPLSPADATLWLNGGGLAFTQSGGLPVTAHSQYWARATDLDLDGDLDLLLAGGELHAYANDGSGSFTELGASSIPPLEGASGFDVGDSDVDGDPDVVIRTLTSGGVALLQNDGTGALSAPAYTGFSGDPGFADVGGDGWLDVHVSSYVEGKPVLRLLQGDGTGTYATAEDVAGAVVADFADLDEDGDLEGLGTAYGLRVWLNVRGGAVAREAPLRIAKPFPMAVFGEPLTPWALAASTGAASIPLAPFGTLQLDPAHLWIVASGFLPASGRTDVSIPVGPHASLVGHTLHWQGLVGSPPRFTPREPALVTAF